MPYKSEAQRKYFNAAAARGQMKKSTVNEWNDASKGMKVPKKLSRGGLVIGDNRRAEGTRTSGRIMFARGGELPEPEGEEMEPPNMDERRHSCPECGAHFAFGGEAELPEPRGEETEPQNQRGQYMGGLARGGEIPEPAGEEMEPPNMVFCPRCGNRFSSGGEIPEPEGEEMEPENQESFMRAMRKKKG